MARAKYATVKIPEELAKTLDDFSQTWGYRSRAEIVDDAIRMYILRMKELTIKTAVASSGSGQP